MAAIIQNRYVLHDACSVQGQSHEEWEVTLGDIVDADFTSVNIKDCWLRVGDLSTATESPLTANVFWLPPPPSVSARHVLV